MEKKRIGVKDLVNNRYFCSTLFHRIFYCRDYWIYTGHDGILFGGACRPWRNPLHPVFTKTDKFGMVTILCLLMGIATFMMGYGPYAIGTSLICGLAADFILGVGQYKSWKHMLIAYCVFSEWVIGSQVILFLYKDAYLESYRASQGDAYVEAVSAVVKSYMIPVDIVCVIVGAIVGAYIGRAILKKHFKRAGIV